MTQVAEGVKAAPVAVKLAAEVGVDVPIALEVHGVLIGEADGGGRLPRPHPAGAGPRDPWRELVSS